MAILILSITLAALELTRPGWVLTRLGYVYYRVVNSRLGDTTVGDMTVGDRLGVLFPAEVGPPARIWERTEVRFSDFLPDAAGSLFPPDIGQTPLIAAASDWKVLEDGSDQGTGWRSLEFDDRGWKTIQAPLVFGPDSEPALIGLTQQPDNPVHTFYFRREFTVEDPSIYRMLDLELLHDHGAVVYLNGTEVFRSIDPANESPAEVILEDWITPMDEEIPTMVGNAEILSYHQPVAADLLLPGRNLLAVELTQPEPGVQPEPGRFALSLRSALISASVRFAVIGDYGVGGPKAEVVANLVKSWNPDLIITTGDNNYPDGEARTIDKNVGRFYHDYIAPYRGQYGRGADQNRFFPSLGNHDWPPVMDGSSRPHPYLDYFTLPPGQGDERYYDFQWGPVQFFALDSNSQEPDGITSTSDQALWLRDRLQQSEAPWKLVYMHHTPVTSSNKHPPTDETDWPFVDWGASLVMAGHNHSYERIDHAGLPYIINGLGGDKFYTFGPPVAGSQVRFTGQHGAMLVQAGPCQLQAWFITIHGAVMDSFQLANPDPACQLN